MTDKADLVGRAAARLDLEGWGADPQPPKQTNSLAAAAVTKEAEQQARRAPTESAPPRGASANQGPGQVEIDLVALQKEGLVTPQGQTSRIAEEFRLVKRPLLRIAFDSRAHENGLGHVIMVTSCHPNDGKTFVSTNLALSMASERDLFVLVIDADIRRRGLSRRLGVAEHPGIMDALLNPKISISDVMLRTNIPNLGIVPAGQAVAGTTELFASNNMAKLVRDIATRYKDRIIIFDTPPVLAASEAGVLASHVGQVVFVTTSGETSKRSIAESLRLLEICPHVHFVLNRAAQVPGDQRFGYYDY